MKAIANYILLTSIFALSFGQLSATPLTTEGPKRCLTALGSTADAIHVPRRGKFSKKVFVKDFNNNFVEGRLVGRIDHDRSPSSEATYIEFADLKLIVNDTEYFLGNSAMQKKTPRLIAQTVLGLSSNISENNLRVTNGPAARAFSSAEDPNSFHLSPPSSTYPDGVEYWDYGFRFEAVEHDGRLVFRVGKIESFAYQYLFFNTYLNLLL